MRRVHSLRLPRVLAAGATGYLGGNVAVALHSRGCWVRALARPTSRQKLPAGAWDEVFVGHATDYESLGDLCDGIDLVFCSLGVRSFDRNPTFWDVDCEVNMNVLHRAQEAGVRHFIFVLVLHGDRLRDRFPAAEAREQVVDALKDAGMVWTIF